MVIAVSLLTAILFGSGDFLGGLAAKRMTVAQVVVGSHIVGLAGVTFASLLLAESFDLGDLALGAIGGLFGGLGVALLYRRLAVGPMHVVAPLTAITSAVVPTAWGMFIGERLSSLAWGGVVLGMAAIGLISAVKTEPDDEAAGNGAAVAEPAITIRVVVESLLAGLGFGMFFIFLDATDAASAPWPVVGARIATSSLLLIGLAALRRPILPGESVGIALIVATGLFDAAANVGFLYATIRGELAIVSVLTSLYPLATVVLARLVLGERMSRLQSVGVAGALLATTFIALG